jgi:AcrR family transcriptional regulator
MAEASSTTRPRKAAGRPRRSTLDAVIEAACELGVDSFEMTTVAERLGIGVATLYGYVEHRDHLVRLAAARCARREQIVDRGQSWQDVLRGHAAITFDIYQNWPQLVAQTMSATVGSHVEVAALEGVLALLIDRGLAPEDAANLYYGVNQIVVGAAVGVAYLKAIEAREGSYDALVERMIDERGEDALPAIRKCSVVPGAPTAIGDYRTVLEAMLSAQEAKLAAN